MATSIKNANKQGAFTLAEVAVTIVIVGMALLFVLQALNVSKMTAAHTRNLKVARELAKLTLGQLESGLWSEEASSGERFDGTYAEEGYESFYFEVALGDESFYEDDENGDRFDTWARRDEIREDAADDEDIEESEEPFEEVKVKVIFPQIEEFPNSLILEKWIPWAQVYGPSEEDEEAAAATEAPR